MPLNIDWQQILLHLFNFLILFAVLYFVLYKPVKQFMDKRGEHYAKLDEMARENLSAAESAKAEHLAMLSCAKEEIAKLSEEALVEIEAMRTEKLRQAEEEAAKIIAEARAKIKEDQAKMMLKAQREISDAVAAAAEKLALGASTSMAYDQFIRAAGTGEADER